MPVLEVQVKLVPRAPANSGSFSNTRVLKLVQSTYYQELFPTLAGRSAFAGILEDSFLSDG